MVTLNRDLNFLRGISKQIIMCVQEESKTISPPDTTLLNLVWTVYYFPYVSTTCTRRSLAHIVEGSKGWHGLDLVILYSVQYTVYSVQCTVF